MGNPPPFCRGGFSLPLPVPPCKRPWGRAGGVPGGGFAQGFWTQGAAPCPDVPPPSPPLSLPSQPALNLRSALAGGRRVGAPPVPPTPPPHSSRGLGGGPRVPPPHASPIPLPPALPAHLHTAGGGQRGGSAPLISPLIYIFTPHTHPSCTHTQRPLYVGGDRILASPPPPFISCP